MLLYGTHPPYIKNIQKYATIDVENKTPYSVAVNGFLAEKFNGYQAFVTYSVLSQVIHTCSISIVARLGFYLFFRRSHFLYFF